jgi:hypothetical protein
MSSSIISAAIAMVSWRLFRASGCLSLGWICGGTTCGISLHVRLQPTFFLKTGRDCRICINK